MRAVAKLGFRSVPLGELQADFDRRWNEFPHALQFGMSK